MRRKVSAVVLPVMLLLSGCGFNKQVIDTTYSFESAIVQLPDGTIVVGDLDSWTDFPDGDCVQVTIDGKTYLVHSSNAALIHG